MSQHFRLSCNPDHHERKRAKSQEPWAHLSSESRSERIEAFNLISHRSHYLSRATEAPRAPAKIALTMPLEQRCKGLTGYCRLLLAMATHLFRALRRPQRV
jgi:hypothetical protein